MGHFKEYFEEAKTFLSLKCPQPSAGQFVVKKVYAPSKYPKKAHYVACPKQKKNTFLKLVVHFYFYILFATICHKLDSFIIFKMSLLVEKNCLIFAAYVYYGDTLQKKLGHLARNQRVLKSAKKVSPPQHRRERVRKIQHFKNFELSAQY
jgi:hypothetical protein